MNHTKPAAITLKEAPVHAKAPVPVRANVPPTPVSDLAAVATSHPPSLTTAASAKPTPTTPPGNASKDGLSGLLGGLTGGLGLGSILKKE